MISTTLGCLALLLQTAAAQDLDPVAERIRNRLEAISPGSEMTVSGETILAAAALRAFYQARLYEPAWTSAGRPRAIAREVVQALERSGDEGLRPDDYHLIEIRSRTNAAASGRADAPAMADLELLLTDAFLVLGSHLLMGRINPETIDAEWIANRRGADLAAHLHEASSVGSVTSVLESLRPPQDGYRRLVAARRRYAALVDLDWPPLATSSASTEAGIDPRWQTVRERLRVLGDYPNIPSRPGSRTDSTALHMFQIRHGLAPTGALDSTTISALNVSPRSRLHQIDLNLERWRWLPQELGERHILVNIAAFEMRVVDGSESPLMMRVIVGRDYRRTPVFSGLMTYLVLAPYWHVPTSIAVRDKLPLVRRNPGYLRQQQYRVFSGWGADAEELDPDTVDWTAVGGADFPYRLRQEPGPFNALGDVKFMFPNKFNVYLHDTPQRDLFGESERTFSSGCIRLEEPLALARYLLADQPYWNAHTIQSTVDRRVETTVRLTTPIPVHLLYWTSWAEDDGTLHFRRDIYARDARLAAALTEPPPE